MRDEIKEHIDWLKKRIDDRRDALLIDERSHRIVENRVISPYLADIPGMNYYLKHSQLAKENYGCHEVKDQWSHGTYKKGEIYQRYPNSRQRTSSSSG
jgi:hypothetical protein